MHIARERNIKCLSKIGFSGIKINISTKRFFNKYHFYVSYTLSAFKALSNIFGQWRGTELEKADLNGCHKISKCTSQVNLPNDMRIHHVLFTCKFSLFKLSLFRGFLQQEYTIFGLKIAESPKMHICTGCSINRQMFYYFYFLNTFFILPNWTLTDFQNYPT